MSVLLPSHNPVLLGHDPAIQAFEEAYASGRMHHAWLLTGTEGIGKATLAYHVAHFLLSGGKNKIGNLDLQHPSSRLITAGAHPDLFVLERTVDEKTGVQRNSIPVEQARAIAPHLRMTPTHGQWRVALLDGVDHLNRFGQNAILKMIEEPPPQCIILMTATTAGTLLPTIRSRCRVLPLEALSETIVRQVLESVDKKSVDALSHELLVEALHYSGGSAGFALKIIQTEAMPLFRELMTILKTLPHIEVPKLHALADKLGRKADGDSFDVVSRLFLDSLRAMVRSLATGKRADSPDVQDLASVFQNVSMNKIFLLWDSVNDLFQKTETANLDRKLTLINAVTEIRRSFS